MGFYFVLFDGGFWFARMWNLIKSRFVQALTVTPPPAPENDPSSPRGTEAPAKGGGKGKAAPDATEKSAVAAPGKMIVEAALDWTGMEVLEHETTRFILTVA